MLFFLIMLGALVGVFKPYINGLNRKHFGLAAVAALVVSVATTEGTPGESTVEASAQKEVDRLAPFVAAKEAKEAAEGKWEYREDKDEMRGTVTKLAHVRSENTVDLDFPYGKVNGTLWVRKRPEDGLNVMFEVDKGQVLCHSFSDGYVSMKFDDGPIQKFSCSGSSDGSSETAFIENESRALAALKKSKRVMVEAEFFQQGRQQFTFETAGLKWE